MSKLDNTVPASGAFAITASDTADLRQVTRGLYVGVQGNVRVALEDGSIVTLVAMAAGVVHPFAVKRVYSTSTTATDLVAVY